jgi:serine protease Do
MKFTRSTSFILLLAAIIGFAGGITFLTTLGASSNPKLELVQSSASPDAGQGRQLLKQFSAAFEQAAARINPSVVPIFAEQTETVQNPFSSNNDPFHDFFGDQFFKRFFGPQFRDQKQTVHSLGSGVIVSRDGYILTNNHVVQHSDKLTVEVDKKKYSAKVIGTDPETDVAVVKIDADNLPAAALGNSDDAKIGEWVIAVGNPFELLHTVTTGIVSATGRSSVGIEQYEDFIQTDASINPGNSGGALADLDGNVIGINTAISSPSGGNVGIGFAIPINMARKVMEQLIETGKVTRGFLGLVPQDIDDNLAKALNLKSTKGSLVGDVSSDGPADKAGIKRGDIITSFNDKEIEDSQKLREIVAETKPGSTVPVAILRDGKGLVLNVTLAERPNNVAAAGEGKQQEENSEKLGLSVEALTPSLASQLGYEKDHGVVVTAVADGSPASETNIRRGDLIKEVNKSSIHSVSDFTRAIAKVKKGDSIAFLVRRGENTFYAATEMPS